MTNDQKFLYALLRMVNPVLGQWSYILICVLILLTARGSDVDITLIESAVAKGAVCLDGSPPAYQFNEGIGEGVSNWLVHIEGGGWCQSTENCASRMNNGLGSSKLMNKFSFTGILSNNQEFNPNFYNWNRVVMRYCDGSSFTGDVEEVDPATNLHFRGARVFNAIVEELLAKGMKNASKALLSGCSAGGLATFLHCDKFRALFPTTTTVKCLPDAGYFLHAEDVSGKYHFEEYYDQVVQLHGSAKNLPPSCTSKMRPTLCFFPQFVLQQIQTPIFVLNSAYDPWQVYNILAPKEADPDGVWSECSANITKCTPSQLKRLQAFRSDFLRALSEAGNNSSRGWFIDSCYTHCQSENQLKWLGNPAVRIRNKVISEAVGDWYYDRITSQMIDNDHDLPLTCGVTPFLSSSSENLFCMPSNLKKDT